MRVINVSRNDLGLIHSRPIQIPQGVSFSIGNLESRFLPENSRLSAYIIDSNQYYQSDNYLQQIQQFEMWRSTSNLDLSIYLVNSTDAVIGATMQQYIFANPQIANMFDRGMIGMLPQGMPADKCLPYTSRVRYLESMDGITQWNENTDDTITEQVSGDDETYIELSTRDQVKIHNTWDFIKSYIRDGYDVSDLTTETKEELKFKF